MISESSKNIRLELLKQHVQSTVMQKFQKSLFNCFVLTLILCICFSSSIAQDSVQAKKKQHWVIQPYFMFPTMDGTIGLGQLPEADIHAEAGDIFDKLQFGAMLYVEYFNDRWAFSSDIIYMDLSQDVLGKKGIISGKAGAEQFVWELAGLRKIRPWLEAGIGARLWNIKSTLDLSIDATVPGGPASTSRSISETWVDPVLIARAKFAAGKRWFFDVRGDLGGFGIGSDFTWQAQTDAYFSIAHWFRLGLGFRVIGVDFDKGSGSDRFLYNVDTFGPVVRLGFHF